MMKSISQSLCMIVLLTFFCALPSSARAVYDDGIIAVVNDAVITVRDLQEYWGVIYMSLLSSGYSELEIQEAMAYYETSGLQKLIDDKLMIDAAKQKELIIPQEAIDQRLERIQSHYDSRESFISDLIAQGMTLTDLRQKIQDQLRLQYIEDIAVRSKIFISPRDVSLFYSQNPEQFQTPEQVDLKAIFIPHGNSLEDAQQKAQAAYEYVKNLDPFPNKEQSFESIANNLSKFFPIGLISKGETVPEIEKAVFNLAEGEISSIVELDDGFFIFYVNKKIPKKIQSLEKVKDQIYNFLFHQHFQKRRNEWLESLRKDAYIDIRL